MKKRPSKNTLQISIIWILVLKANKRNKCFPIPSKKDSTKERYQQQKFARVISWVYHLLLIATFPIGNHVNFKFNDVIALRFPVEPSKQPNNIDSVPTKEGVPRRFVTRAKHRVVGCSCLMNRKNFLKKSIFSSISRQADRRSCEPFWVNEPIWLLMGKNHLKTALKHEK